MCPDDIIDYRALVLFLDILLTSNFFEQAASSTDVLSLPLSTPLIKLTDFGLSRFIDLASPLLTTRCGSEAYAAPELVMGASRGYDARQTDAWACGIVLYALATRALPFDHPADILTSNHTDRPGLLYTSDNVLDRKRRTQMLHRIAHCQYSWPETLGGVQASNREGEDALSSLHSTSNQPTTKLLISEGLKKVVSRLLVRDPAKRARMVELWDEEWMQSDGAPPPPQSALKRRQSGRRSQRNGAVEIDIQADYDRDNLTHSLETGYEDNTAGSYIPGYDGYQPDDDDDGMLVDGHSIDDIARQELKPS